MRLFTLMFCTCVAMEACGGGGNSAASAPVAAPAPAPAPSAGEDLLGDIDVHDPSLLVVAGQQYVFGTRDGIQRLTSSDGKTWRRIAPVFTPATKPAWWDVAVPAHTGMDVWAPKVFIHRNEYWVMYSISTFGKNVSAIGLASASSADASQWADEGIVVTSAATDDFNAIDPDVFIDTDGRVWMQYGSFWNGIRQTELDATTLRPIGASSFIASRSGGAIEAPTLMRRGNFYYLFVSFDICCSGVNSTYNIRVGRATSPGGPFVDKDGKALMAGGGTLIESSGTRWKGPGHQDVFGNTLARHAYDANDGGKSKLRLSELQWSSDGWPAL